MNVSADKARCEGHGLCEDVASQMYRLDDEAVVTVVHEQVPEELEKVAEAGARVCPVAALTVTR